VGASFADHDRGCIGIPAHKKGHDRRVSDAKPLHAINGQIRTNDAVIPDTHPTCPTGMIHGASELTYVRQELIIGRFICAGADLLPGHLAERWSRENSSCETQSLDQDFPVVLVGKKIEVYPKLWTPVRIYE
jgi:hypothetical protein